MIYGISRIEPTHLLLRRTLVRLNRYSADKPVPMTSGNCFKKKSGRSCKATDSFCQRKNKLLTTNR